MTAQELAEKIKAEIASEVEAGRIPVTVKDFSDLHSYCDANQLGDADEAWGAFSDPQAADAFVNEAQNIVDAWIKNGGLR